MARYTELQEKSSLAYTCSIISTAGSDNADKATTLSTQTHTSRWVDRQRRVNRAKQTVETKNNKILDNVKMPYSCKVLSKGFARTIFKAFAQQTPEACVQFYIFLTKQSCNTWQT